jgi:hypothetical protein
MVLVWIPACGSDAGPLPNAGLDGGLCSRHSSSGLGPGENYGSGIITGVDVSASVCNIGVLLSDSQNTVPPGQLVMQLNYSGDEPSEFDFQRPVGAYGGSVGGFISAGKATPGVYASADDPTSCGILSFDYGLPVAPGPDSIPLAVSLGYETTALSNCVSGVGRQAIMGSWTLRLNSIAPNQPDAGSPYTYTAHGQLTASLVGASPSDTATFALAF